MTNPFGHVPTEQEMQQDRDERAAGFFDPQHAQNSLLIVRIFDAPRYFRTKNCLDGMVYPNAQRGQKFEPFPNQVVRGAVADLGSPQAPKGAVYPDAIFFPASLTKPLKVALAKGQTLLLITLAKRNPNQQTADYILQDLGANPQAVAFAQSFLGSRPDFLAIQAPEPYDERPPGTTEAPAAAPTAAPVASWNTAAPPAAYVPQPPAGNTWNTSAPDPWATTPAATPAPAPAALAAAFPQAAPVVPAPPSPTQQSFLAGAQDLWNQHPPQQQNNNWGQPQTEEPPF